VFVSFLAVGQWSNPLLLFVPSLRRAADLWFAFFLFSMFLVLLSVQQQFLSLPCVSSLHYSAQSKFASFLASLLQLVFSVQQRRLFVGSLSSIQHLTKSLSASRQGLPLLAAFVGRRRVPLPFRHRTFAM
jgi:hypothetical protein